MKTALILTTINVPIVIRLFREYGPEVVMFVAGDRKTPPETEKLCDDIDAVYLSFEDQYRKYPVLSNLVGENTYDRKNFALLEALKWGAEVIVSIDDDNLGMSPAYFAHIEYAFSAPFAGVAVQGLNGWFDVGQLLIPKAPHRGFPIAINPLWSAKPVTDAKVGVVAGICMGDPDIDSVQRIANSPIVHNVSELLRSGIVVDPDTRTVFNWQNTAVLRQFAPTMFMIPGTGRHADIYASLICQRVMRDQDYHVHFGQPFVWQERNAHDPIKDLRAEIDGMERILEFSSYLDKNPTEGRTVLEYLHWLHDDLGACTWWPEHASEAGLAWCDEVEKVLK